jgi:hypothetical protein
VNVAARHLEDDHDTTVETDLIDDLKAALAPQH